MKAWYEELFSNYAEKYDQEPFTQGTMGECDFLERELEYDRSRRILDIGCGTGRHAIELTKRGYSVVGIDLSGDQLRKASEKAGKEGLQIRFERQDARNLSFAGEFDAAIMLCEGGFSLMETDEMNFAILNSASRALVPGGRLIFNTLNGLFPLFHSVKEFINKHDGTGMQGAETSWFDSTSFDLMSFRQKSVVEVVDDDGARKELNTSERFYVPTEISWLLKSLGFARVDIFGARLGEFSRSHALSTEDYEMLVIADKLPIPSDGQ